LAKSLSYGLALSTAGEFFAMGGQTESFLQFTL
jgi:hypothetical protein